MYTKLVKSANKTYSNILKKNQKGTKKLNFMLIPTLVKKFVKNVNKKVITKPILFYCHE